MQIEGTARVAIDAQLRVSQAAAKMVSAKPVPLQPAPSQSASTHTALQASLPVVELDLAMETPVLNQPSPTFELNMDLDLKKFLSMMAGLITDLDGEAGVPGGLPSMPRLDISV